MKKLIQTLFFTLFIISCLCSKQGLGWPWNGNSNDFSLFRNSKHISWVYNWENWRPQGLPSNFEYIAMQRTSKGIEGLRSAMLNNHARILLGFNEPDISSQANMSPDQAVRLWHQYIKPTARDLRHNGIPWLRDFL